MMMKACIAIACAAACTEPPPVAGTVDDLQFSASGGCFGNFTDVGDGGGTLTATELQLGNYDVNASLRNSDYSMPDPAMTVYVYFQQWTIPATGSADAVLDGPGDFALNAGHAADGLAAPAAAEWLVRGDAKDFTGGTVTIDRLSSTEMSGSLVMTTPDGDYVSGSFDEPVCASPRS